MKLPATLNHLVITPPLQQSGQQRDFDREPANADDSRQQAQTRSNRPAADFVFRGELLDVVDQQRRYRPQFNQQIPPQNRLAIESYLSSHSVSVDNDPRGRLLDRFA